MIRWCRACCSALKNFDILEETLSDGRKFLINNEFSVADISVGYAGQTLKMLGVCGIWNRQRPPPASPLYRLACLIIDYE